MTAEQVSDRVELSHIQGLHFIVDTAPEAVAVGRAAVAYQFPQPGENLSWLSPKLQHDPDKEFEHWKFAASPAIGAPHIGITYKQSAAEGPIKVELTREGWFIGGNCKVIAASIKAATGIDRQAPTRVLEQRFSSSEEFSAFTKSGMSPVSAEQIDSRARRRVYKALVGSGESAKGQLDEYIAATEDERVALLESVVSQKRNGRLLQRAWNQKIVVFGVDKEAHSVGQKRLDFGFEWGKGLVPDDMKFSSLTGMGGYYDLERHCFVPRQVNESECPYLDTRISPKHPSPATTEKAIGPRLDAMLYYLGSMAAKGRTLENPAFLSEYRTEYQQPVPKDISLPRNGSLYLKTHGFQREKAPSPNIYRAFFQG